MNEVAIALMLSLLILAAACGHASDGGGSFVSDPEPYITVEGTPLAIRGDDCSIHYADQVHLLVTEDQAGALRRWLERVGFTIVRETSARSNALQIVVGVPLGAVPDAVERIRDRRGVLAADAVSLLASPDDAATPPINCTPSAI